MQNADNYLRNVILGKDGEPKRLVRKGDREPMYIMENGKPMLINKKNHERKMHQIKSNPNIVVVCTSRILLHRYILVRTTQIHYRTHILTMCYLPWKIFY